MIMNFDKETETILDALGITADQLTREQAMKLATACFMLFDKGVGWERERVIPIIQRMAISPMPIVNAIRKPIR